jgi:type II secretory pathway component GspD/PulD (secretin)
MNPSKILVATSLLTSVAWAQLPGPAAPTPPPRTVPEAPVAATLPPAATPAVVKPPTPTMVPTPTPAKTVSVTTETSVPGGLLVTTNQASKNLISVQFEHAPLTEVIRAFTVISGANIVLGTNGHETVTLSMKDVEWEPALRAILDSAGKMLVMKSPGIFVVGSKADLANEPVTVETVQCKYIMAQALQPMVEKMLVGSNTSVAVIQSANALLVKAMPSNLTDIRKLVETIDQPRQQVFIEAKFVELNDQAIKDIGINWQSLAGYGLSVNGLTWSRNENRDTTKSTSSKSAQWDKRQNTDTQNKFYDMNNQQFENKTTSFQEGPGGTVIQNDTITPTRSLADTIDRGKNITQDIEDSFKMTVADARAAVLSADAFSVVLSALKQNIGATIVSNPRLLVASGQKATIHVGEDRPYARKSTTQQGTGGNSTQSEIDQIKTGVELNVTPTVNMASNITLKIVPRLSRVTGTVTIDGNEVPILTTRDVDSEFNVDSGRTVAIGGLTTAADREKVSKIPLLGDIPILGKYLFSHTHTEKVQDEVIIFVSVGVVRAESIKESEGIPSTGQLIHRYQLKAKAEEIEAKKALEAEAKQLQEVQQKKDNPGRRALFE